jgi:hypothetical protein
MSPAYANTEIGVGKSQGGIEDLLNERGVSDIRWTQTAMLKILEFSFPLREVVKPAKVRKYHTYRGTYERVLEKAEYSIRAVLGVRIVVNWNVDPQEQKRLMRVLFWMIKSKFEIIDAGLAVFEEEFMPHLTLGRGRRVFDEFRPKLEAAIKRGDDLSAGIGDAGLVAIGPGKNEK